VALLLGGALLQCGSTTFTIADGGTSSTDATVADVHAAGDAGHDAALAQVDGGVSFACLSSLDCTELHPLCCAVIDQKAFRTSCVAGKTCPVPRKGITVEPCEALTHTGVAPVSTACISGTCAGYSCDMQPTIYACANPEEGACVPVADAGAASGGDDAASPVDARHDHAATVGSTCKAAADCADGVCCIQGASALSGTCVMDQGACSGFALCDPSADRCGATVNCNARALCGKFATTHVCGDPNCPL
jgi:hypothetical protein